tara:strand:- start:469 stop:618 length:150 start_codon:yes stop_codon:yes gene_type:complete
LKQKKIQKNYIYELIKKYPKITSGRKNILGYEKRISKTLKLIKDYLKKK